MRYEKNPSEFAGNETEMYRSNKRSIRSAFSSASAINPGQPLGKNSPAGAAYWRSSRIRSEISAPQAVYFFVFLPGLFAMAHFILYLVFSACLVFVCIEVRGRRGLLG
jgi:hypothetical protein